MRKKIEVFLTENFLFEFDGELTYESDLFKAGILDSMGYIQLIQFIEREFHFTLSEEELLANVLVSFNGIADFVSHKIEARANL
jgi:D-alanine--poly(phosphoribitol) ligase subunit 2